MLVLLAAPLAALPPTLPEARANNPVARLDTSDGALWFTGLGVAAGKAQSDIRADGWLWMSGDIAWQPVPALPAFEGLAGRLGSHAVVLGGAIHVIGGYTVAEDHAERSTPGVYRLRAGEPPEWDRVTTMPVPVDDAVALVHGEERLLLVSGWSDTGNVNLVQVWDAKTGQWTQAEPWPGAPVFGHAGGLIGDALVVCGGARIEYPADGPRQFRAIDVCWRGDLRADDPRRLDWRPLPPLPGGPRYRAGALGLHAHGADRVVFVGGADRAYNYDGIGYDDVPAEAMAAVVSFDLDNHRWDCHTPLPKSRMDLRGLVVEDDRLVVVGGLDGERRVVDDVLSVQLSPPRSCNP
ncbi:MAG: hypothetical protein RQ729_13090 [Wenzhouxiangellaceae bacterium]|nr:hypothetical protein [Wenzhouxiangellaceae bacterium]